jgi:hypothetical protein
VEGIRREMTVFLERLRKDVLALRAAFIAVSDRMRAERARPLATPFRICETR